MKTSRAGSSVGCAFCQASRCRRTSSRACSAAVSVFFERQIEALEAIPKRGEVNLYPQPLSELGQRGIGLRRQQRPQRLVMRRRQQGLASSSVGFGLQGAALSPTLLQFFHKRGAHPELLGDLSDSLSFVPGFDHPFPQVHRISFRHRILPFSKKPFDESTPRKFPWKQSENALERIAVFKMFDYLLNGIKFTQTFFEGIGKMAIFFLQLQLQSSFSMPIP
jgi:hypothetical protein